MKGRIITIILFIAVIGAAIVGCGKSETEIQSLRVAHFPNITHSQALLISEEQDSTLIKNKDGASIPIEWKVFNAGPAEVEALLAGEVDIGYIGPGPAVNAFVKSKGDVVIIAGVTYAGAVLVSGKDLQEQDVVKVLDGKKIAVPQFGNTQDLCLRYLMEQYGLKDVTKGGTVEIVQAANPDIKTLLEQKEVDAALVPEPWGARLNMEIGARIVLDFDEVWRNGKYSTAVIVARKELIKNHPELVEQFLKEHVRMTLAMQNELEKNKNIVNAKIGALTNKALEKDVLDLAFERMQTTYDPSSASVMEMAKMSKDAGFLRQVPENINDIFELSLLNKVLSEEQLDAVQ